jgi:hypothetical protein
MKTFQETPQRFDLVHYQSNDAPYDRRGTGSGTKAYPDGHPDHPGQVKAKEIRWPQEEVPSRP